MAKLTITQLTKVFNTTNMTIYNWRKGTVTRRPLPTVPDAAQGRVLFDSKDVEKWAKEYHVPIVVPVNRLAEASTAPEGLARGPKAMPKKAVPAVPAKPAKATKDVKPAKVAKPVAKKAAPAKKPTLYLSGKPVAKKATKAATAA
jgi:hypothetical protein